MSVTVRHGEHPLRDMEAALDAGASLILFPEGMRSSDDEAEMLPFKPGLYHLARRRPDVELVPVFLENLNRILPKGEYLYVPLMAAVSFGAPITLRPDEPKLDFLRRAQQAVAALAEPGVL